jgi:hypothetical protein
MKYLSDYMEQAQTEAFNKFGAFFAFGNKQFEEKRKPDVQYVSMGAGLICPKESAKLLADALENIYQEAIKADVEENGAEKIIEREYFNHETQLTGDTYTMMGAISGHIEAFPELFTPELIHSTCKKCFDLAVENDWF